MTRSRRRHRQHGNPFNIRESHAPLDVVETFGRAAPIALEIGFGSGLFTVELAQKHPEWNVLGLEIRQHLVESLLDRAARASVTNIRGLIANANLHLDNLLPPASVVFVSINFPDPWFKKRHHKRRVVQPHWLDVLATKLAPGAQIHCMTDYGVLAQEMLAVFESHPRFENAVGPHCFAAASTTGIVSEREQSHTQRGEPIYRFHFQFGT